MNDLQKIEFGNKFDDKMCDKLFQTGTELIPRSTITKNPKDEGWVIVPPEEYMASKEKYDEWVSLISDIIIDSNIGNK